MIPLKQNNVDTDQIIPASFLKGIDKSGMAEGLFSKWRYLPDGTLDPQFPLNQRRYQAGQILLAGENFGSGSSREHAVWALTAWGFRAVVCSSCADIFRNNALKNGLLPVVVDPTTSQKLFEIASADEPAEVTIDLVAQQLHLPDGSAVAFPIDLFNKRCLLEGIDQFGYLLKHAQQIAAYEKQHQRT